MQLTERIDTPVLDKILLNAARLLRSGSLDLQNHAVSLTMLLFAARLANLDLDDKKERNLILGHTQFSDINIAAQNFQTLWQQVKSLTDEILASRKIDDSENCELEKALVLMHLYENSLNFRVQIGSDGAEEITELASAKKERDNFIRRCHLLEEPQRQR